MTSSPLRAVNTPPHDGDDSDPSLSGINPHRRNPLLGHDGSGWIIVVGIGADGMDGIGERAHRAITSADVVVGSWRQLQLVPDSCQAMKKPWPSPLVPHIAELFDSLADRRVVVLASGDPMFFGIGTTLARILGPDAFTVIPAASSASLACARLGWGLNTTPVVSLLTKPVEILGPLCDDGIPFLVLCRDSHSPADICDYLCSRGLGEARVDLLSDLGSSHETHTVSTAHQPEALDAQSNLCIVAVTPEKIGLSRAPGRPDRTYANDGQLTKSDIRALTLAALAPHPGEVLWDIGGGSGSVSIEWCRLARDAESYVIEHVHERAARITTNSLGYPITVVHGKAPDALDDLPSPDAVFIGGGLTHPRVVDRAWEALRPGGRFVANAVTVESEQMVLQLQEKWGGSLTRFEVSHHSALGSFHAWRPVLPIIRFVTTKPAV